MTSPLKLRILEEARRRPAAKRPPPLRQALPFAGAAIVAVGAMAAILRLVGGTAHAAGRPDDVTLWVVGGMALLAVAATALALPPRRSMLPRPAGQLIAVMVGVPLLAGVWISLWHAAYADPFVRAGFRCFALTAATAPWPFAALAFLRRRADPVHPAMSGGGLGAAAGAWAAAMVELWCPLADSGHVAVGHVAPLVLIVLAGAAAGARLFRLPVREV